MIIAIDPGVTGALACVFGGEVSVEDLPSTTEKKGKTSRSMLNAASLVELLKGATADGETKPVVIIEHVHAMPKTGSVANFSQGYGLGLLIGICTTLGADIQLVSPVTWKKKMGLSPDKEQSRQLALKLFPQLEEQLRLKKHHNRAESLLLLHYALEFVFGDPFCQKISQLSQGSVTSTRSSRKNKSENS